MDCVAGDLLLFYGRDWLSRAIAWVTRGPSHVGIIASWPTATVPAGGLRAPRRETSAPFPVGTPGWLLFESTTLCGEPCRLAGRRVAGVQAHDPQPRVDAYPGAVARMRLTSPWRLDTGEERRLRDWLRQVASEPYDWPGALVSGTRVLKWSALMPDPDLGSLFCSELCAAVLMRLQRLPLGHPGRYNPATLVRALRRCGTYGPPQWIRPAR